MGQDEAGSAILPGHRGSEHPDRPPTGGTGDTCTQGHGGQATPTGSNVKARAGESSCMNALTQL